MPKCDFIEITLRQGHSPVNLLHIFRTPFFIEHLSTTASQGKLCKNSLAVDVAVSR